VNDEGLKILIELLPLNKSLHKIRFQECETNPFSEQSKKAFCEMIQNYTEIEEIKIKMVNEEKDKMFLKEVKSKLKTKKKGHAQYDHFLK